MTNKPMPKMADMKSPMMDEMKKSEKIMKRVMKQMNKSNMSPKKSMSNKKNY